MNDNENLYNRIKNNNASWDDFSMFLKFPENELNKFLKIAFELKINYFGKELKVYVPDKRFPAISITGNKCELNCEHCNEKYLKGMKPLTNSEDLYNFLINHAKNNGVGVLISGGCLSDGSVPLLKFIDTIKKIKEETDLIINTHTGLINENTARKLADAHVDIVSFDINVDQEIINNIYHLNKTKQDYKHSVEILQKYELNIVPHICIGLYYGKLHKELECIHFIKEIGLDPSLIVLIALIPPNKSKINFKAPKPADISKIIALTRIIFPDKEISLGCMRPRGKIREEIEKKAIKAGVNRIEMPSRKTLRWLKKTHSDTKLKLFSSCCAVPNKYEKNAKMKDKKVQKYLRI